MKVVSLVMLVACGTPPQAKSRSVSVGTSIILETDRSAPTYSLEDATDREHQLFDAINTTRTSAGLPALTWSSRVAFIAHHTPPGSALDVAHQPFGKISVDLATTPSVDLALQAWMKDDHQRAHLLDAAATQVAVAVSVQPDNEVVASVVVLGMPPRIDPIALDTKIENAVETRWRRKDGDLHTTAQVVANLIARGATDQVKPELTARLANISTRFSSIHNSITRVEEPDRLEMGTVIDNRFAEEDPVAYGVGVAQASEVDGGAIYVVAVYGRLGR